MLPWYCSLLTGESRIAWKHGIERVGRSPGEPPPPAWNPNSMRRSLTARTTKTYSTVCLRQALASLPPGQAAARGALQARLHAQQRHWPEKQRPARGGREKSFTKAQVAEAEAEAEALRTIEYMRARQPHTARLPRSEVPFLARVAPAVLEQYSAANCGLYPAQPPRGPPGPRPSYTDDRAGASMQTGCAAPNASMQELLGTMAAAGGGGGGGGWAAGGQAGWGSSPAAHSPWGGPGRVLGGGSGGFYTVDQDPALLAAIAASLEDVAGSPGSGRARRSPSPAPKRQRQDSPPPMQQQQQQQQQAEVVDLTADDDALSGSGGGAAGAAGSRKACSPAEKLRELRLKRFA